MACIVCLYQCTVAIPPPSPPATSRRWRCDLLFLKIYNNIRENHYTVLLNLPVLLMGYWTMITVFTPEEMQLVKSSPLAWGNIRYGKPPSDCIHTQFTMMVTIPSWLVSRYQTSWHSKSLIGHRYRNQWVRGCL